MSGRLVGYVLVEVVLLPVLTVSVKCRAGKFLGDKRADVAEKGFGRPFQKVLVTASGMVDRQ